MSSSMNTSPSVNSFPVSCSSESSSTFQPDALKSKMSNRVLFTGLLRWKEGSQSFKREPTAWHGRIVNFYKHSLRKQQTFGDATTSFPVKWRLRNEHRNSILMTRHYPDLGDASDWLCRVGNLLQPIRSTIQFWVVARHQYGISVLVSQTSFCGETSRGIAKCWLFSQAIKKQTKPGKLYLISRKLTWLTQLDLVTAQGPGLFQNTWRSHSWEPHRVHKRTVSSKFNWFQPSFTCIHIVLCLLTLRMIIHA